MLIKKINGGKIMVNNFEDLPDNDIEPLGILSNEFLERGIATFKDACNFVHDLDYGYNTNYEDPLILFKELHGTCTSKHAVIAGLAQELGIPLYKSIGIYRFTEDITDGVEEILLKYDLPYIPMVHCFLVYNNLRFDMTEGNNNGKKKLLEDFIYTEIVDPFISRKDEYFLFKKVLNEIILPSAEMQGKTEFIILKAREEAIKLLKKAVKL
jgi:hypothetical protein